MRALLPLLLLAILTPLRAAEDTRALWGVLLLGDDDGPVTVDPMPHSPAERSGIRAGDVVVHLADREIHTRRDLLDAIAAVPRVKPTFAVTIKRGEETLTLTSRCVYVRRYSGVEDAKALLAELAAEREEQRSP